MESFRQRSRWVASGAEQGVHGLFRLDETAGGDVLLEHVAEAGGEIEERGIRPRRVQEGAGECRIAHAGADRPGHGLGPRGQLLGM